MAEGKTMQRLSILWRDLVTGAFPLTHLYLRRLELKLQLKIWRSRMFREIHLSTLYVVGPWPRAGWRCKVQLSPR